MRFWPLWSSLFSLQFRDVFMTCSAYFNIEPHFQNALPLNRLQTLWNYFKKI
jgi:hypothetical protein